LTLELQELQDIWFDNLQFYSVSGPITTASISGSIKLTNVVAQDSINQIVFSASSIAGSVSVENAGPSLILQFPNLVSVGSHFEFENCSFNQLSAPLLANVGGDLALNNCSFPQGNAFDIALASLNRVEGQLFVKNLTGSSFYQVTLFLPVLLFVGSKVNVFDSPTLRIVDFTSLTSVCSKFSRVADLDWQPNVTYTFCPDFLSTDKCVLPDLPNVQFPNQCGGQITQKKILI
jgi:hypothetical protein